MLAMPGAELAVMLAAIFVIGALIGSVGIGGLLLAPMLVSVAGIGARQAIAISMASFMATGLVALWLFARGRSGIGNRWALIVATMPGALAGAFALWALPDGLAVAVLALFLVITGARLLYSGPAVRDVPVRRASTLADTQIGVFTGFFSALTGTGGPMVMVPMLVWRGVPLMTAVAVGQLVQLPISGVATLGNYANGGVDFATAALIGVVLMPGVVAGRRTVEMIPVALVTRVVAVVLVAAGCWLAWRAI